LVYAGQLDLKNHTNSFLRPQGTSGLYVSPFDPNLQMILDAHLLLRADWVFDDRTPRLLKTFVDYRDGKLPTDQYSKSLIPAEFVTGRTNSRMDVLAWTNVAGLHIPVQT